jgi:hypothetical protein
MVGPSSSVPSALSETGFLTDAPIGRGYIGLCLRRLHNVYHVAVLSCRVCLDTYRADQGDREPAT